MGYRSTITQRDLEQMLRDETTEPKALPLSLLEEITDSFSDQQQIGIGGFAVVYKGKLQNRIVAVKRMSKMDMDDKVFHREIQCLMMVKHKNVVRFLGYCADRQGSMEKYEGKLVMADVHERLLCFEYLPNGSLHDYITDTTSGLQWRDRYHIIKGICEGLHYLHNKNIVHLDLKPGNILLDGNLVAKIADFGLSRCFDERQSRIITLNIGGTLGYLAPEFANGEITYHFDIYSLGVIIIEILTGKKGYHIVDEVVESWSNRLEESKIEVQLEQVRVCCEIGIQCTNYDPAKRPDTHYIINRLHETESMDKYINIGVVTPRQNDPDMLVGTMHALWLSYQQLNPDVRRCIEYCSIFPLGSKLRRDELVHLWIAQGFVRTNSATEDVEDMAGGYIQELVSCSFLQPIITSYDDDCLAIHGVLHDILDKVAGNCFRIENERRKRGKGWKGDIPRDIQHLYVQNYDGKLIFDKILGLKNLRTLIVHVVEEGTSVDEKLISSICKRLPKLRVLAVAFSREHGPINQPNKLLVPESIFRLKHLRYLAFRTKSSCTVVLPSTLAKLEHIQLLDFGACNNVEFTWGDLINLRHVICGYDVKFPSNIGMLISLHTIPEFKVRNEQGYEIKQLRGLNKLRGRLAISGLEYVKSKKEALEANLAAKEGLTKLTLKWWGFGAARCTREVEAEVLEGMCPPVGLEELHIRYYEGSRYPDWMMGKKCGGPENLRKLHLHACSQLVAPVIVEAFPHLRVLKVWFCQWGTLPDNMEHLTSLKKLEFFGCFFISSLPTLPTSLEKFHACQCQIEFMESCQTVGHPNWQKIEHIPMKCFGDLETSNEEW